MKVICAIAKTCPLATYGNKAKIFNRHPDEVRCVHAVPHEINNMPGKSCKSICSYARQSLNQHVCCVPVIDAMSLLQQIAEDKNHPHNQTAIDFLKAVQNENAL